MGWDHGGGGKYLLPCCCIRDYIKFDMQHDHFLKKLNFDLLSSTLRVGAVGGGGSVVGKMFATMLLQASFPLI